MIKKIQLTLIILATVFLVSAKPAQASTPTACSVEENGFCMRDENQLCPGGEVRTDVACSVSPEIEKACCIPLPAQCGKVQADGSCVDNTGNTISGANACERNSTVCCTTTAACGDVFPIENIIKGPSNAFFDALNPLKTAGNPEVGAQLSTPGGIVSRLLQFLFPLSGLVLFVMIIWGGFEILTKSSQGTKAIEAGRNRITAAIIGFLLLFATYWIAQIIEVIFGIVIV